MTPGFQWLLCIKNIFRDLREWVHALISRIVVTYRVTRIDNNNIQHDTADNTHNGIPYLSGNKTGFCPTRMTSIN